MMLEQIRVRAEAGIAQLLPGELEPALRAARVGQPAQVVLAHRAVDFIWLPLPVGGGG